jgi:hypothetical protein
MKYVTIKSGAIIGLQIAEFDDGMKLLCVVLKQSLGIKFSAFSLSDLFKMDVSELKDVLVKVITSSEVQESIWTCMASCTYQGSTDKAGVRITRDIFKTESGRADFFPVASEVATFNLAPFFKNLELPSSLQDAVPQASPLPSGTT